MRARLDPSSKTGLALSGSFVVAVAATWALIGISQDVLGAEELALLDPLSHDWVLAHRVGALDAFLETVTWLGATAVTVPLLVVTGGLLARRRHSWAPVLDIVVVYGSAVLLHAILAQLIHRDRPPAADWLTPAVGWAYPSGHTTQAVAAWGILALLVSAGASLRTRALAGPAAAIIGALVALSRIYLGVHWSTDVLGAAVMSAAVLATWSLARPLLARPLLAAPASPRRRSMSRHRVESPAQRRRSLSHLP